MTTRVYRQRTRQEATERTRSRILEAARELLADGEFQHATVDDIASRAGVARATLYQHFGSRMGLVDAFCDVVGDSPEYEAIAAAVDADDPVAGLEGLIEHATQLWASEQGMHRHLYGLAEVDPAAREFVERQTRDRRSMVEALVARLRRGGHLRRGLKTDEALGLMLVLTSFHTYEELRRNGGLDRAAIARALRRQAGALLAA